MVEAIFYDKFEDYKDFILKLGKNLHSQVETNLSEILKTIGFNGTAINEKNCDIGRTDLIFFLNNANHSLHFEIFNSKSQVPQDLRLLEQSIYDKKIAVIIDIGIKPEVENEYLHKMNPKNNFDKFYIGDFFLNENIDETKKRLQDIICKMVSKSNSAKQNVIELTNSIIHNLDKENGLSDPIREMERVKKIAEYLKRDIVILEMDRYRERYGEAITSKNNKLERAREINGGSFTRMVGRKQDVEIYMSFIKYFFDFLPTITSWLEQ